MFSIKNYADRFNGLIGVFSAKIFYNGIGTFVIEKVRKM